MDRPPGKPCEPASRPALWRLRRNPLRRRWLLPSRLVGSHPQQIRRRVTLVRMCARDLRRLRHLCPSSDDRQRVHLHRGHHLAHTLEWRAMKHVWIRPGHPRPGGRSNGSTGVCSKNGPTSGPTEPIASVLNRSTGSSTPRIATLRRRHSAAGHPRPASTTLQAITPRLLDAAQKFSRKSERTQ